MDFEAIALEQAPGCLESVGFQVATDGRPNVVLEPRLDAGIYNTAACQDGVHVARLLEKKVAQAAQHPLDIAGQPVSSLDFSLNPGKLLLNK